MTIKQKNQLEAEVKNHIRKYDLKINNEVALKKIELAIQDLIQKVDFKTKQKIMQTDGDWQQCFLALYGSLQKMQNLGIDINRSDDWFINNYGKKLTAQYMYTALLNAIKNKGLICLPSFYFVYKDEKISIKKEEGQLKISYEPCLKKPHLTLKNIEEYEGFVCEMIIKNLSNELIFADYVIMSPDDILKRKAKSTTKDKGEFVWNYQLKKQAPKEDESIWEEWTARMIEKTLVIAAFQKTRYTLPELQQVLQFANLDDDVNESEKTEPKDITPEPEEQIDLKNPSKEILDKAKKIEKEYEITPELKIYNRKMLKEGFEVCRNENEKNIFLKRNLAEIYSLGEEGKNKFFEFASL